MTALLAQPTGVVMGSEVTAGGSGSSNSSTIDSALKYVRHALPPKSVVRRLVLGTSEFNWNEALLRSVSSR